MPEAISLDLIDADTVTLDASGETGPRGAAATIDVGVVTTLEPDAYVTVENVGDTTHAVFDFGIPGNVGAVGRSMATLGDGFTTSFVVAHPFGTVDVMVELYDLATLETIIADVSRLDSDRIAVTGFVSPPPPASVRVIIFG
jgi:hypothetical protein